MKFNLQQILSTARAINNGELSEDNEMLIKTLTNQYSEERKQRRIQEEYGEDLVVAALNIINK